MDLLLLSSVIGVIDNTLYREIRMDFLIKKESQNRKVEG
jgi:hypothetical protein